jgi:hypothetical protein
MEYSKFTIDDDELRSAIAEFAPKGKVRSYDELYDDARKKMDASLAHYSIKQFGEEKEEYVLASADVSKENIIDSADVKKGQEIKPAILMKALFEFAFIFGNYSEKRAWIRIDSKTFIKFPYLIENKGHSVFVMLFAKQIAKKLETIDNAFITILQKNKIVVPKNRRSFCFSKGHLMNDKDRIEIMSDLKYIFEQLNKKDVNNRTWVGLKYFV